MRRGYSGLVGNWTLVVMEHYMKQHHLMAKKREERSHAARELIRTTSKSDREIARIVGGSPSNVRQWRLIVKQMDAEKEAFDAMIRQAVEDEKHRPPAWATHSDWVRRRVFAHLRDGDVRVATGGRYTAWITPALRYAFGDAFLHPYDVEGSEDEWLVKAMRWWGCTQDAAGVWSAPPI